MMHRELLIVQIDPGKAGKTNAQKHVDVELGRVHRVQIAKMHEKERNDLHSTISRANICG